MIKINSKQYKRDIKDEERLWNKTVKEELNNFQPDYKFYQKTIPYKIYRDIYVKKMLSQIVTGDKVLELGCYNGWFTLEMARKGAVIDAYDLSSSAISIAKKYFSQRKKIEKFTGSINYYKTDLNYPKFSHNSYDKIVIRNVLHHLINYNVLYKEINFSLRKNGLILVDDALPCGRKEAFITGILLFLLPTDIPYSQKIKRVFKQRNILSRTQGLVDAKGSSPFESITGKEHLDLLKKVFKPDYYCTFAAFVGTIAGHLIMPDVFKKLVLIILNYFDKFFIKIKLINGSSYYLEAQKK